MERETERQVRGHRQSSVIGRQRSLTSVDEAARVRVPRVARRAVAAGLVAEHSAVGVEAARARARVHALVVDARTARRAVGVDGALGAAALVRVAEVAGLAGAGEAVAVDGAHRRRAAGRASARVLRRAGRCLDLRRHYQVDCRGTYGHALHLPTLH